MSSDGGVIQRAELTESDRESIGKISKACKAADGRDFPLILGHPATHLLYSVGRHHTVGFAELVHSRDFVAVTVKAYSEDKKEIERRKKDALNLYSQPNREYYLAYLESKPIGSVATFINHRESQVFINARPIMETIPLGGVIALAVLLPNVLAVFLPPTIRLVSDPQPSGKRMRIMTVVERIGQVGSFVIPFFYRLRLAGAKDAVALAFMIGTLILYYVGWVRYIVLGRAEVLFYRPLFGIPLPMAVMPVIYFLAASVLLDSVWLLLASVALGAGHLTISWLHSRSID